MKRRIISILLTLSIFLSIFMFFTISANALPTYKIGIVDGSTNVYCLPDDTSSMKIGSISSGKVHVYWQEGNSYYIQYSVSTGSSDIRRGYVPISKITVSGVGNMDHVVWKRQTLTNQKVYNRSSTSSLLIGTVYSSDIISVMQEDGDWYYIQYPTSGGYKRGYIPKSSIATYYDMGWRYPLDTSSTFSKISYGYNSNHHAIDIISKTSTSINGQSIKCPTSGTVIYSKKDPIGGNTIAIKTNSTDPYNKQKIRITFQHMQEVSTFEKDDTVKSGSILGKVGSTGSSSTGPHLHFNIRTDDEIWTNRDGRTINPQVFYPNVSFTGDTSTAIIIN